jgi:hypothetical protein
MADSKLSRTKNAKVSSGGRRTSRTDHVITISDGMRGGLPANCIVMPMRILDPPEPIKNSKKKR